MKALAAALVKAQGQIEGAKKDSKNPHFKSSYADLASVWDACRTALQANGFSIIQVGEQVDGQWALLTILLHESGDQVRGYVPLLNTKGDMQGLGSALTYARRYGLAAIVGVCPEDDDGNAASEKPAKKAELVKPAGYDNWLADFEAAADNGLRALKEAWDATTPENRAYLDATDSGKRDALKARAKTAVAA